MAVDWSPVLGRGRRTELPTYPFQRDRYWLTAPERTADPAAHGLLPSTHPWLAAVLDVPGTEGADAVLTGRLSTAAQPWLADHRVFGRVVVPGTALLDLAVHAAHHAGVPGAVGELVLHTPLRLPETGGGTTLRCVVTHPSADGRRTLTVYSGTPDAPGWTAHATGTLAAGPAEPTAPRHTWAQDWPVPDTEPVDLDGSYETSAERGLGYGPAFRGLRSVRLHAGGAHPGEVYAEVALPRDPPIDTDGYGLHPALLDAVLHATRFCFPAGGDVGAGDATDRANTDAPRTLLPFAWTGVSLWASGATSVRARVTAVGPDAVRLDLADEQGRPVLSVERLQLRAAAPGDLPPDRHEPLYTIAWEPLAGSGGPAAACELWEVPPGGGGGAAVREALRVVQEFLADAERSASVLVVVSRGAVVVDAADAPVDVDVDVDGPVDIDAAGVWGLLRSAQSEHPGRLVLLDVEATGVLPDPADLAVLAAAGEPQIALRAGIPHVPRLTPAPAPPADPPPLPWPAESTVLVTGGTGGVGAHLVRHLVRARGARHVVVLSRTGPQAPGAEALAAATDGAVEFAACDVTDRAQVAALLERITADRPLGAVVHAAGALDDGVLTDLTPERLDRVRAAKVGGALVLDELTRAHDPAAFVVFSSAAGVLGAPGQAAYAAANAALDALTARRRALGLPGQALSWGLWEGTGMASGLGGAEVRRLTGSGFPPLPAERALALLDAALAHPAGHLLPLPVEPRRVGGPVPPLLRRVQRPAPARPSAAATTPGAATAPATADGGPDALLDVLAPLPHPQRLKRLTELTVAVTASVLGHTTSAGVDPDASFTDLGLDSLTGVELRNRLGAATGLQLPATLTFDRPTCGEVAAYLVRRLSPADTGAGPGEQSLLTDLDRVAATLARLDPEDSVRRAAVTRLLGLVSSLDPGGPGGPEAVPDALTTGSDDDIFDFIDRQLGV